MLSFGGPAGQIAVMHRMILGEEEHWVSENRFQRKKIGLGQKPRRSEQCDYSDC